MYQRANACRALVGQARIPLLPPMSLGLPHGCWPEEVVVGCSIRWDGLPGPSVVGVVKEQVGSLAQHHLLINSS